MNFRQMLLIFAPSLVVGAFGLHAGRGWYRRCEHVDGEEVPGEYDAAA